MNIRDNSAGTGMRISPDEKQARIEAMQLAKEREAQEHTAIRQAFAEPDRPADLDIDIDDDMEREFPTRKDTNMAMSNTVSGVYSPNATTARPTIADTLESAVSALSNAASELTGITDRLCGSPPPNPPSQIRGVPDGAFAQIDQSRGDIEAITESILANTSRIRGRL